VPRAPHGRPRRAQRAALSAGRGAADPFASAIEGLHEKGSVWEAAERGDVGAVLAALRDGDVGLLDPAPAIVTGMTLMHIAAWHDRAELVAALHEHGAPLDEPDDAGFVPLHLAATTGAHAAVRALLAAGADACAQTPTGATALHFAASEGHSAIVADLADGGASLEAETMCTPRSSRASR
jgi:hypothetical protein